MITIKKVSQDGGEGYLRDLSLEVGNGEVFFLLCGEERVSQALFEILCGCLSPGSGQVGFDGEPVRRGVFPKRAVFLDRADDPRQYDAEARAGHWIDFMCRIAGLPRERVYKNLLVWNFPEEKFKQRIKELRSEEFKLVYLALLLSGEEANIVIFDFLRGVNPEFELFFDRLLWQMRQQGKAILYLSDDVFLALKVANRVQFIKGGHLLPLAPIQVEDLKKMDLLELYDRFLSRSPAAAGAD